MLMLWRLTWRSVVSRPRAWVVGLLAAGAAAVLTPGLALVETIAEGTRRSLVESGTGELQVYHSGSRSQPVMLLGPTGEADLKPLEDFPRIEAALRTVEGLQEVVPLEVGRGEVSRGNYLDDQLAAARAVAREPPSAGRQARLEQLAAHLRRTFMDLARDERQREQAFTVQSAPAEEREALARAESEAFWAGFVAEPLPALEFLENRVAPLAGEGQSFPLDYLGTDLPRFAKTFARFELLEGQVPPPHTRGVLLGQAAYEQSFKLPLAFRLDEVRRELERGTRISEDEGLRTLLERNREELPDLLSRLAPAQAEGLRTVLERVLGHAGELGALLREFLTLDDDNFAVRYQLFSTELAPHLPLYLIHPGELLEVSMPGALGGGLAVRVWGIYRFRGMGGERGQANATSLMDPVTARWLVNRFSASERARQTPSPVAPDTTEDEGGLSPPAIVDVEPRTEPSGADVHVVREELAETFSEESQRDASVMQAALVLGPGVSAEDVSARVQRLATEQHLPLATVDWQVAGGFLSGVVGMGRVTLGLLSLLLGGFVLLLSASTLLLLGQERVGEVGTLRALGMQRRTVFLSLLLEGVLLGGVGGALGAGLGALVLQGATGQGLAVQESLQFFLGGPVLYPQLRVEHGLGVLVGMMVVTAGAALVPAWRGGSVTPVSAMRRRED